MKTMFKAGLAAAGSAALLGASLPAIAAEYAHVISATPVTNPVAVPRQECVDTQQLVQPQPSGAGAVIGAIAGGVIGNQFGHGFGRAAATGLGAIAGSAIGNNVEANAASPSTVPVRRCHTVNAYEHRVVGYDVVYEYNGRRYSTRLPDDPGARLALDIRPAGSSAPLERAAPQASYGAVPPAYAETAPVQVESPVYYTTGPAPYYAPAPVYYPPPVNYVAPAVIGAGVGYLVGRSWYGGHRHGGWHRGGHRHWRR